MVKRAKSKPKARKRPAPGLARGSFVVDLAACERVRKMAGQGMAIAEIGAALGMHGATLRRLRKAHPEFDAAYQQGRAEGIDKVTARLRSKINSGNIIAILFWLKTQCRWSEMKGSPAAQAEDASGDLSPDEMRARIMAAAKDWPEDLFRVMFDAYQERHNCVVRFEDALTRPPALPAPAANPSVS